MEDHREDGATQRTGPLGQHQCSSPAPCRAHIQMSQGHQDTCPRGSVIRLGPDTTIPVRGAQLFPQGSRLATFTMGHPIPMGAYSSSPSKCHW